jgi:hypothetical protein
MGGNAIVNHPVRRYSAKEYFVLENKILTKLRNDFPGRKIEALKAYRAKADFGDMDILFESDGLALGNEFKRYLMDNLKSKEVALNGPTISFEHQEFQIDLIFTKSNQFSTSAAYYGWNDLGNFCGCLAKTMGLKLGHDGLSYAFSEGDQRLDLSVIATDWKIILPAIGLDYEEWEKGFDMVEDIFKFVVNSRFFNRDIYLLENRNHRSRVRDAKRQNYTKFLSWLMAQPVGSIPEHPIAENKSDWLPHLFQVIPGFEEHYRKIQSKLIDARTAKNKFNGEVLSRITGLKLTELGLLMKDIRSAFDSREALSTWALEATSEQIETDIRHFKDFGVFPVSKKVEDLIKNDAPSADVSRPG